MHSKILLSFTRLRCREAKISLTGVNWKYIKMLVCWEIISVATGLSSLHDCCFGLEKIQGKADMSYFSCVCPLSVYLWCKYPSIYVLFLLASPICCLILLCCCWHPLRILPLLQALLLLPCLFYHLLLYHQATKCLPYTSHAEALLLLLLLLPLPLLSLSFLRCLTELHSGYVRTKVKVSLPLSRET